MILKKAGVDRENGGLGCLKMLIGTGNCGGGGVD